MKTKSDGFRIDIQTSSESIDWAGLERETVGRIRLLRAIWGKSERDATPEVHRMMVRDLYFPILEQLAMFCAAFKERGQLRRPPTPRVEPENGSAQGVVH